MDNEPRMLKRATVEAWQERILDLHNDDRNDTRLGSLLPVLYVILQGWPHGDEVHFATDPHRWGRYGPEQLVAELVRITGIAD